MRNDHRSQGIWNWWSKPSSRYTREECRQGASARWITVTAFVTAGVLAGTLAPFDFSATTFRSIGELLSIRVGPDLSPDVAGNVLLFLPLGFALSGCLERSGVKATVTLGAAIGASFALSYAIEVLQSFLPGRVTSLSDVLSNTAGGALGFLGYYLWLGERIVAIPAAYLTAATLIAFPIQWSTTLRDWDDAFPLIVGNEHTGNRPWRGHVFDLAIFDRALAAEEVAKLYVAGSVRAADRGGLIAAYDLSAGCPCADLTSGSGPLVATRRFSGPYQSATAAGTEDVWLETPGPVARLIDRVKRTSTFTLAVTVASTESHQVGPGRIVSLSTDPTQRNFTLAQSGSDLEFRLRTPLTGANGSRPSLVVASVFSIQARRHIVVTYDGADVLAYIDGIRGPNSLRLGLGAAAFAPLVSSEPTMFAFYDFFYFAAVFVPAGFLLVYAGRPPSGRATGAVTLAVAVIAWPLLLEAALASASGRSVSGPNVLLSTLCATAGCAIAQRPEGRTVHPSATT